MNNQFDLRRIHISLSLWEKKNNSKMASELKMIVMITSVMFQGTSVNLQGRYQALHLLWRIATSKKMKENSNLHYISMSTVPATLYKSCPHPQRDTKFQIEAEAQRSRSRNCPWWTSSWSSLGLRWNVNNLRFFSPFLVTGFTSYLSWWSCLQWNWWLPKRHFGQKRLWTHVFLWKIEF